MRMVESGNLRFCIIVVLFILFFFFQAEDGIRDLYVTGVQTCALPICCSAAEAACRSCLSNSPADRVGHPVCVTESTPSPEPSASPGPLEPGRQQTREPVTPPQQRCPQQLVTQRIDGSYQKPPRVLVDSS